MSQSKLFRIYESLPVSFQNVACTLAGVKIRRQRYNRVFWQALAFLRESQWWSYDRLVEYQNKELNRVIKHAYETVPYYGELFNRLKLKPQDIKTVQDLEKLPVLDKQTVRLRHSELISKNWPKNRMVHGHTGGTTGTAVDLVYDIGTSPWQWAVWWRHRERSGIRVGSSYISFGGRRTVVPLHSLMPPFWRRNLAMKQTFVSVHHMTTKNMSALVDYLQKRKVDYYSGYPSALYLLASHLLEHEIRLKSPPKVIFTGAETVLSHQREVIEEALHSKISDQYGAAEYCGNISQCEHHRYHVDMEYGAVEFLPIPNMPPNVRRIVCSGFKNYAMPLIRYAIGDVAIVSESTCDCGRASPVVDMIDGRIEAYIITPDGRQLGRLDHLFKEDTKNMLEVQIIQESIDRLTVRVVPTPEYDLNDEKAFLKDLRLFVGSEMAIDIDRVDQIPREANGKFRQVISRIAKEKFDFYHTHLMI